MTPAEQAKLTELNKAFDLLGPVREMEPTREYPLILSATRELVELLRKQITELQSDRIEDLENAFRQIAHRVTSSTMAGWWDTMALSTAKGMGEQLVAAGLWERHPDGCGRRWFYRPIEEPNTTNTQR